MADYLIPTKTFTWATGGTATAPTVGKQASGWAVGERPPAPTQNWITQSQAEFTVYLSYVFYDAATTIDGPATETGPGLYLGANRDAAIYLSRASVADDEATVRMLSDNFSTLNLRPDAVQAEETRIGLPGSTNNGGTFVLSPDEATATAPIAMARLQDQLDPANVPSMIEAGCFRPLEDSAGLSASFPRDRYLCKSNLLKAWATFSFQRGSSGSPVVTVIGSYNCSVSGSGAAYTVTVLDAAGGLAGYDHSVQLSGAPAGASTFIAVDTPILGVSTFSAGLVEDSAGTWVAFGSTATTRTAFVFVGIY